MTKQRLDGEARERLIKFLQNKMDDYGITLDELASAASDATPVYGDAKGNVWNGRGEQPEWLRAASNAGANPEFFRIANGSKAGDSSDEVLLSSGFFRR